MKEKYESPEVEIIEIDRGGVDIIFASNPGCDGGVVGEC